MTISIDRGGGTTQRANVGQHGFGRRRLMPLPEVDRAGTVVEAGDAAACAMGPAPRARRTCARRFAQLRGGLNTCAKPVAPGGWPFAIRPPLVLTGIARRAPWCLAITAGLRRDRRSPRRSRAARRCRTRRGLPPGDVSGRTPRRRRLGAPGSVISGIVMSRSRAAARGLPDGRCAASVHIAGAPRPTAAAAPSACSCNSVSGRRPRASEHLSTWSAAELRVLVGTAPPVLTHTALGPRVASWSCMKAGRALHRVRGAQAQRAIKSPGCRGIGLTARACRRRSRAPSSGVGPDDERASRSRRAARAGILDVAISALSIVVCLSIRPDMPPHCEPTNASTRSLASISERGNAARAPISERLASCCELHHAAPRIRVVRHALPRRHGSGSRCRRRPCGESTCLRRPRADRQRSGSVSRSQPNTRTLGEVN
jgi:hypothetical protein